MITKMYWMGEDIDTLPAEKLREIIIMQQRRIETSHKFMETHIQLTKNIEAARRHS